MGLLGSKPFFSLKIKPMDTLLFFFLIILSSKFFSLQKIFTIQVSYYYKNHDIFNSNNFFLLQRKTNETFQKQKIFSPNLSFFFFFIFFRITLFLPRKKKKKRSFKTKPLFLKIYHQSKNYGTF